MTAADVLDKLDQLARLAGIEEGWWDFFGTWRPVSPETKRAFLTAMGFAVATDDDIAASLTELDTRPWLRWLEPVRIVDQQDPAPFVTLTLPAARDKDSFVWSLEEELGAVHGGKAQVDTLEWQEERWINGVFHKRWRLHLPAAPALGYHCLRLAFPDNTSAKMRVIVAPARAHVPDVVDDGAKAWGIATQIYALRTPGDWGVGTYKGLADLAAGAARLGAAAVGVNPLHALFPGQPERFSPYSPSSRRFLNTTYIDVEAVPEYKKARKLHRKIASPGFQAVLASLRNERLVDYPGIARMQRPVLEELYQEFRIVHLEAGDARAKAFHAFQSDGGSTAHLFCLFEALQEHFTARGVSYWRQWPEDMRHPALPAVAAFAAEHRERVEFFWWMQFIADEQLGQAQRAALDAGAGIGLYRDLGVGIAGDGAEAWLEQDCLSLGVSVGAPPDPLALKGQDWGLVPFNPIAVYEAGYAPFVGVMAANMRHAGALRLDHAMALQRLYWVPAGSAADQGAYVRYPVDDLFRLVALESHRNRCLVIGEDLGTVPEGFRDRMGRMALFAYRVMVFEKDQDQQVRKPQDFDEQALATFATHDLPSMRGWWNGTDIGLREKLDLYPREGIAEEERHSRRHDREKMVAAFHHEGLLPASFPVQGKLSDSDAETLATAAHAYLASARSRLMMVQVEDVLAMESQMNLPGTVDQYANWRLRFPVEVEAIVTDPRLKKLAARLKKGRG
jgi:4-alpha-glucanotransferase